MGQKNGKAAFVEEATPFTNLSFSALERLWEAFNDVADGFGISQYEMEEICAELLDELKVNRTKMNEKTSAAFKLLDTDQNDLVDALEFLAATATCSAMSTRDKLEFVLNAYDFDGSQELTIDEVTLAMKSTLTGLCKMSEDAIPREEVLEIKAMHCVTSVLGEGVTGGKVEIARIIEWAAVDPEIVSWLAYYDDCADSDCLVHVMQAHEIDYAKEAGYTIKAAEEVADIAMDPFAMTEPSIEKMAEQPWSKAIESLHPSEFIQAKPDPSVADAALELEWVYGFRAEDCKANVRYTNSGEIVYHAGRVGVMYNALEHKQRYFMGHTYDIVSFALHPNKRYVATGEAGENPKITVWDTETRRALATIDGFHKNAVVQLSFSADGTKLVSVGQDKDHAMAVYVWAERRRVFSGKCGQRKVLDACFGEGDMVVTCGVNHIYFWSKEGETTVRRSGVFGRTGKMQALTCLAPNGTTVLSGTVSGHIYVWLGRNCMRTIAAHQGCVSTIYTCPHGVVTGGKDQKVRLWTLSLEPGATFDMSAFGSSPSVRSVCLSEDGTRILVGTKGSEIYEVSAADGSDVQGGPITIGHYAGNGRAIAVHPMKPEFATVGDDGTLRIWDIYTRNLVKMTTLDTAVTSVAYHPNGDLLVVGLGGALGGGGAKTKKDGAFVLLNEPDLSVTYEARDAKHPITVVRYSPDGEYMALGSQDSCVYLYATAEDYEAIGKCRRHNEPITHLDFSEDSKWLQTNGKDNFLHFFNAGTAQYQSNLSAMRDVPWATQTCSHGWSVQGVHSSKLDGNEVQCLARSHSGTLLALGDNMGNLKVVRYPCWGRDPSAQEFRGHMDSVGDIVFANEDSHVVTIGANDRVIMQWKVHEDAMIDDADVVDEPESDDYAMEKRDGSDLERDEFIEAAADQTGELELKLELDNAVEVEEVDPGLGATSTTSTKAAKPWVEAIAEPTSLPKLDPGAPRDTLRLEWVHGYRAQDCRQNLFYTAAGGVVYPAAKAGIRLDPVKWQQDFNLEHSDDVLCLAISPDRKLVATGQLGSKPSIIIWDAETCATVRVLRGFHRRAVLQLAWSPDGRLLGSLGADDDHSLAVYDWKDQVLLAKTAVCKRKMLGLAFGPLGERLMTVGVKSVGFWDLCEGGRQLRYEKALISTKGRLQAFMCCTWIHDTAIAGTADGHLYTFEPVDGRLSRELTITKKAHDDMITSMCPYVGGLCTGGKDGMVKLWDFELSPIQEFDVRNLQRPSISPRIRSVDVSPDGAKILVGTQGSEIYEMNTVDGSNMNKDALVQAHFKGQLWGLAVHPNPTNDPELEEFITVGDDCTIRKWDLKTMKLKKVLPMDSPARAVAYKPDGTEICVGLGAGTGKANNRDGAFVIFQPSKDPTKDLAVVHEDRESQEWVRTICYSPDGRRMAIGCEDNQIYVYDTKENWSRTCVLNYHSAPITALDFTEDSLYMQSTDSAGALHFGDVLAGVQIPTGAALRDVKWANQTCPLGWAVKGMQKPESTKVEVTAAARSSSKKLVVGADNFGRVSMYHHPAPDTEAGCIVYRGHGGVTNDASTNPFKGTGVTRMRFSANDSHVISLGGGDRAVFQWRVVPDPSVEEGDKAGESGDDSEVEVDGGEGPALEKEEYAEQQAKYFTAVKPWVQTTVAPSRLPDENLEPPNVTLELEHAYGQRSADVRGCLLYNANGSVLFPSAAVGVVYDPATNAQSFHIGHRGDVISMAVTDNGLVAATGDSHAQPQVRVWDAMTGQTLAVLPRVAQQRRGISALAFSRDGKWCASVGQDTHHTVAAFTSYNGQWSDALRVATTATSTQKVLFALFIGPVDFPLMLGGVKHAEFLTLNGRTLMRRRAVFGKQRKVQPLLCAADFNDSLVVTGTVTGHFYLWSKDKVKCERQIYAHDGPIYAVAKDKAGLVSGSKDGYIKLWDHELKEIGSYSVLDAVPMPLNCAVHSVTVDMNSTKMLLATKSGDMYEIVKDSGTAMLLNECHSSKQLLALATHPTDPDLYATAGDDGAVRIWSASLRRCLSRSSPDLVGAAIRAMAWYPDGSALVVGCGGDPAATAKDGTFVVLEMGSTPAQKVGAIEIKHEDHKAKLPITDIAFCQDGSMFAIASEDCRIYIHDGKDYSIRAICSKTTSPSRSLDWSTDTKYLRAATRAFELIFFDAVDGRAITTPASVRDVKFGTNNTALGWSVQGIWPQIDDGFDIQTVDKSKRGDVLAKGDDAGNIRLVHFPCTNQDAGTVAAEGHATHVAKVRFSADDSRLITCGGFNRSILQYKVVPNGADPNGIGSNIADLPPVPPADETDTALEAKSDDK